MPLALRMGLPLGFLKSRGDEEDLEKFSSVEEPGVQQKSPQCSSSGFSCTVAFG